MTCIVGLIDKGKIYMGGDSAGSAGWDIRTRKDGKVFIRDNIIIGCCGSYRMTQLLQYKLEIPKYSEDFYTSLHEYMVKGFVESVRKCFNDGGFAEKVNEVESGGIFLIGIAGHLFNIECDYQVGENTDGYDAIGCGEPYALASLYNSKKLPAKQRVQQALETAEYFSNGVRRPFTVLELDR